MIPLSWRNFKARYRLVGVKCETCGEVFFPPRKICPNCRRKGKLIEYQLSGKGKIYSFTVVRTPPKGFEKYAPYIIGIVKLDEGPMVLSQIVDAKPEELYIGMPVRMVFRKIFEEQENGLIHYGYKFTPV